MLEARALRFAYRTAATPVLSGIDWSSQPGSIEALVGPNGAGKTTLLRLFTGELPPSGGTVQLEGKSLAEWSAADLARRRAVLAQSPRLQFDFTVEQVVLMGREPHAASPAEHHEILSRLLEELDLGSFSKRAFPALSRGEKQRVQLARVLAQLESREEAARYLFLDEPVNHLDLAHQHLTLQAARKRAAAGHTVVVVLHDLNLALHYADRVSVLHDGRIIARGEPAEVLSPDLVRAVFGVDGDLIENPRGERFLAIRSRPTTGEIRP